MVNIKPKASTAAGKGGGAGQTKKAQLIRMLGAKTGADVATLSERLGWQAHTTRAAMTGLRKAGYAIHREVRGDGKPARYKIIAAVKDLSAQAEATRPEPVDAR